MTEFDARYDAALREAKPNAFRDNYDHRRFGASLPRRVRRRLVDGVKAASRAVGLHGESRKIAEGHAALDALYSRLDDDTSRALLVQLLAYRTLGYRKVRLPLNSPEYWQTLDELDAEANRLGDEAIGYLDWQVSAFDLRPRGVPLQLLGVATGIHAQVLLDQYRCVADDGTVVDVGEGDIVVDGGGCYGETALFFASKAGAAGRVFSFEFLPDNLRIFERNLELNPALRDRVSILPCALWSRSDVPLAVAARGPGTRVSEMREAGAPTVDTLSIDDLVARHGLRGVDFVKLDIEGAELEALRGGEETLRRHRPRLAVSLYHRLSDFWTIPAWLDTLGLEYRFYLRHFTIHAEETVLFALPAVGPA